MNKVSRLFNTDYSVRIYLLGEFRITRMDGTDITPSSAKARCILAILALSEDGEITRDRLTQLLWSRHAQEQARTSLRQSLSLLRRTFHFEEDSFFTIDRNRVYLNKNSVWIDFHEVIHNSTEFLSSTSFNSPSLSDLRTDTILQNLQIHDPAFDDWLQLKRQGLEEAVISTLQQKQSTNKYSIESEKEKKPENKPENKPEKNTNRENIAKKNLTAHQQEISPANKKLNITCIKNTRPVSTEKNAVEKQSEKTPEIKFTRDLLLYRDSLLKKVMSFWINGLLEQSLFKKIRMELQLRESSEQMSSSWKDIVQYSLSRPGKDSETGLRSNDEIGKIFSELSESLLILGAPGSGKTTLLLSLTQQLLERAEQDVNHPLPVVFHLSTWAKQRLSISTWLEDELENRYQMPRKAGAELIRKRGILPLLDGLDEVDAHYREDCVKAINHFRQQNTWLSMAICSREEDYKKLNTTVSTCGTIIIQAITENQCDTYLQAIAEPGRGLSTVLAKNIQLKNLLTTPLMLNIASIAYRDHTEDTLAAEKTLAGAKEHLFSAYTQAMLSRRPSTSSRAHYNNESTCRWLTWLASTLNKEKQSIFYLDSMQPSQATLPAHYWLITQGSVIVCALLTGITLGLLGGFVTDIKYSLGISLAFAVTGGYIAGLLGYGDQIRPLMHIKLSWRVLSRVSATKHIGSIVLAACFGLGVALIYNPATGTALGILWLFLFQFFNALDFEPGCKQSIKPTRPNEGMRKSLRNVAISSIVGGLLGFGTGFFSAGIHTAIIAGALASLLSGLFFGGHTCIQHYLLRFCLWKSKSAPLNYVRFLEYAVDRIFLYRVGGGYIFIHRSLAEYFAAKS